MLALLWQFADRPQDFNEDSAPDWVQDWLSRRRKTKTTPASSDKAVVKKNIHATAASEKSQPSASDKLKQQQIKAKRAEKLKANTDASISSGLLEFQQWTKDQIHTGIGIFIKEASQRCRNIAARLVDAKAASFAARLDELPAKIMNTPSPQQAPVVLKELGQLILLSEAWFTHKDDADVRRAIATAESREQVLAHKDTLIIEGIWKTIGEQLVNRKDGLISHTSWLLKIDNPSPVFAMLQDYYPASVGKKRTGLILGTQLIGKVAFYPSRSPLRALLVDYEPGESKEPPHWPLSNINCHENLLKQQSHLPWSESCPHLLPEGRILTDIQGRYWWQNHRKQQLLPLSNNPMPNLLLGSFLQRSFILWNGETACFLSGFTSKWGPIGC